VLDLALGLLLAAAPPPVEALWPCAEGLSVTYRLERAGADTGQRVTETVRGPGPTGLCQLEQVTLHPDGRRTVEAFVYEHLPDRIAFAGYADAPTAFRPPLLKAPLEAGRGWTFHEVAYRVEAVALTVETPAGTFRDAVKISERALKGGTHRAEAVYAPGVGPVLRVQGAVRWVALEVRRPKAAPPGKSKR
jgi:hypothetical protein